MSGLLKSMPDTQEMTYITLCDLTYSEAMAMMNLVYVGSVKLSNDQLEKSRVAAKMFLNIEVQIVKFETQKAVKSHRKKRNIPQIYPKVSSKRPLMMKNSSPQTPIFFVMPAPNSVQHKDKPGSFDKPDDSSGLVIPQIEPEDSPGSSFDLKSGDLNTMNSYQRAKLRCADKFKCDICGKGFPLSCLLQRHMRTHLDVKPHSCHYCEKSFSSKTSLNHHMFMKHLEEQSKRIEMGKKLIESLKQGQTKHVEKSLDNRAQVIKVLADGDYVIEDEPNSHKTVENMEIIGIQDITQQIAVQMEREATDRTDREVQEGGSAGQGKNEENQYCDNLYYIEGGSVPVHQDYWEYKS